MPPQGGDRDPAQGGLKRALISSSGDDGTQRLYAEAPDLVIPELRPYRSRGEVGTWLRDDSVVPLPRGAAGASTATPAIGEFHLYGADADLPVPRRMVQLARQHKLFLHAHSDVDAVERLFQQWPEARILWAHSGFDRPEKVREMLRKHKNLWCDLAFRTDHGARRQGRPGRGARCSSSFPTASWSAPTPSRRSAGTTSPSTPSWSRALARRPAARRGGAHRVEKRRGAVRRLAGALTRSDVALAPARRRRRACEPAARARASSRRTCWPCPTRRCREDRRRPALRRSSSRPARKHGAALPERVKARRAHAGAPPRHELPPEVTPLGPGRYRAEGLLFHMPGAGSSCSTSARERLTGARSSERHRRAAPAFRTACGPLEASGARAILRHGPWPPPPAPDPTNRVSGNPEAIALGERLFFEPRLSARARCCAPPATRRSAASRTAARAPSAWRQVDRNTPSLLNVRYHRWFGWDGGGDSLWAQSIRPMLDAREMGGSQRTPQRWCAAMPSCRCRYAARSARRRRADDERCSSTSARRSPRSRKRW